MGRCSDVAFLLLTTRGTSRIIFLSFLRFQMVKEVLKLPNTLLVRDKDVKRLLDYQELELILHNG